MSRGVLLVAVVVLAAVSLLALRQCGDGTAGTEPSAFPADAPRVATPERAPRERAARPVEEEAAGEDDDGAPGVVVRVVDEDGELVREGTLRFAIQDYNQSHAGAESFVGTTRRTFSLAASNPVVLHDLPAETDDLDIWAAAESERTAAFGRTTTVTLRSGQVLRETIELLPPRTARVTVIDASNDRPVAGARVISTTEAFERRELSGSEVRGVSGPGRAVTGSDGMSALTGLGPGEHALGVDADGYRHAYATWDGADVRVRLAPHRGAGTVVARVLGPAGVPLAGVRVVLAGTDRDAQTDARGAATFDRVEPGMRWVAMSWREWERAAAPAKWEWELYRFGARVEVRDGATVAAVLGAEPLPDRALEGRLVDEGGAAVAGVKVTLDFSFGVSRQATSDASGHVRFERVPAGKCSVVAKLRKHERWELEEFVVDDTTPARTWTVGTRVLRGRVVVRPDGRAADRVVLLLRGPGATSAVTDEDGRFAERHARAGVYRVELFTQTAKYVLVTRTVTVPSDTEPVIELAVPGRLALRFAAGERAPLLRAALRLVPPVADADVPELAPGTDDDDRVAGGLLPGRWEVEVSLDGRTRRVAAEIRSGETTVVELRAP